MARMAPAVAGLFETAFAGPAQRAQYRDSGAAASSAAETFAPHSSHRPKVPAVTRRSASSVSARRWRAATARRSNRRACLSSSPSAVAP